MVLKESPVVIRGRLSADEILALRLEGQSNRHKNGYSSPDHNLQGVVIDLNLQLAKARERIEVLEHEVSRAYQQRDQEILRTSFVTGELNRLRRTNQMLRNTVISLEGEVDLLDSATQTLLRVIRHFRMIIPQTGAYGSALRFLTGRQKSATKVE